MNDHDWESVTENRGRYGTVSYESLLCHVEERSCSVIQGADFDYCPFCGDDIDG